jgi:ATP-binding cassette subfamily B protein
LSEIDLAIEAGSHVAILGVSGAGKSSLLSLLLGWHRPITGRILVDSALLDAQRLEELRRETAWVDPAIQLWNRPLLDNLRYGSPADSFAALSNMISTIGLQDLLEILPDGLQTPLGEGGGLVSGGEGQRVRLGRAMARSDARLAILDEPFRGLDRERRKQLLLQARSLWRHATLFCITHDISETMEFDRVVIIERGRIIEDGAPSELAQRSNSRYHAMLAAEAAVHNGLWGNRDWRRVRLDGGRLVEDHQDPLK